MFSAPWKKQKLVLIPKPLKSLGMPYWEDVEESKLVGGL